MKQLTELNSWLALEKHGQSFRVPIIRELNTQTFQAHRFKIQAQDISLDFSHQRINETAIELLIAFAQERHLKEKIYALMRGDHVNQSENRPALHTILRTFNKKSVWVNGHDVLPEVLATRERMCKIATQIRNGEWLGYSGYPITDIVNIGIGGSDFGPRLCVTALAHLITPDLRFHFISDADPYAFATTLAQLKPETTLFLISSKSFTTKETLYNAKKALIWFNHPQRDKHFIAITANPEKAKKFGIAHVLPIWDWVGGRYSLCSAINLITCIAIGYDRFTELLAGAHSMDEHFYSTDFYNNMPVIMALVGLWNINFLHIPNLLLLVYARQLEQLVPYLQQLDMESNGKSIDNVGRSVNYATGPIVWGGLGNQAQHSYYQLLCQGTHKVAADFISIQTFESHIMNSFCNAKIRTLSTGLSSLDHPNGYIPGGTPINHIRLTSCSPFCLGSLIALYEHKIYTQSVLWNINSFDQPGVESAKRLKQFAEIEAS